MADIDGVDAYIIAHSRSMTQPEMAQKLGVNKSTVSRRVAKLRAAGELEPAPDLSSKAARAARERLRGCTMDREDRLEALGELRDMLHADLLTSGGASLARVSSEYRHTMEEIESLSHELGLAESAAHNINPVDLIMLKVDARHEFAGECDGEVTGEIVNFTLTRLDELGAISYKPIDEALSDAAVLDRDDAEGGEHDD